MNFTVKTYCLLLKALSSQGFSFLPFKEFIQNPAEKCIVLRHDVDALPQNSLQFAKIQADLGIRGSYYFRIVPESFKEDIIREIAELGHEVGYHYEDVSLVAQRQKTKVKRQKDVGKTKRLKDIETKGQKGKMNSPLTPHSSLLISHSSSLEEHLASLAIESFKDNLDRLRQIVPVTTICMHGSPLSKWDSRLLWEYYYYKDYGIVGEPYFDIDFNHVMYLTDTGRRWDGDSVSIRDRAIRKTVREGERERGRTRNHERSTLYSLLSRLNAEPATCNLQPATFPRFHSTRDIIIAAKEGRLPNQLMFTFHPQRWTDKPIPWAKELVWQNFKNVGKYFLVQMQKG